MSAVGRERKQGHQANKQKPEGCRPVFQPRAHCNCAKQPGVSRASVGLANNGTTDRAALRACRESQPGTPDSGSTVGLGSSHDHCSTTGQLPKHTQFLSLSAKRRVAVGGRRRDL